MLGTLAQLTRQVRRPALAAVAISALVIPVLPTPSQARGPDGIADVAEQVIDSVVNISTSQNVAARNNPAPPTPPAQFLWLGAAIVLGALGVGVLTGALHIPEPGGRPTINLRAFNFIRRSFLLGRRFARRC